MLWGLIMGAEKEPPKDPLAEKRAAAIQYLRQKGKYILDKGSPPPGWKATDVRTPDRFERVFFNDWPAICKEYDV